MPVPRISVHVVYSYSIRLDYIQCIPFYKTTSAYGMYYTLHGRLWLHVIYPTCLGYLSPDRQLMKIGPDLWDMLVNYLVQLDLQDIVVNYVNDIDEIWNKLTETWLSIIWSMLTFGPYHFNNNIWNPDSGPIIFLLLLKLISRIDNTDQNHPSPSRLCSVSD